MKTYYLLRIAAFLVGFVPPRLAYWLCSVVGGILFSLKHDVREAVLDNLSHVLPKASLRARRRMGRRIVRNVVKNYYDLLRLPHLKKEDLERIIVAEGREHIDQALAEGHGVILVGGHVGNYSIVAQIAAAWGYKISIIAEDIEPQKLYDYVNKLRSKFGLRMIKLGSAQVRTIYRLLRDNEGLALAIDRDVAEDGVPTIFFGAFADLPPGPVSLALRLNTPLIPVYTCRQTDNTSLVQVGLPMELTRTGDRDLDVKINIRKLAQVLEEQILRNPSQWVVLQRVWDKDYTGMEVTTEAPDNSAPTSTNGTVPQLESDPPELRAEEVTSQKPEVSVKL
jgi:lauroyl/myristoyl acyltransferase